MELGSAQMSMANPQNLVLMFTQAGEGDAFKPADDFFFIRF